MTTDSRQLYATLLGLGEPWQIDDVVMDADAGEEAHPLQPPEILTVGLRIHRAAGLF